MLSSFSRCHAHYAGHAHYNCRPSYTLRITPRNLPYQKTGRLAAQPEPHEVHTALKRSTTTTASPPVNVCTSFSMGMCGLYWNGQFLVVCWIGISLLRNPRISLSCSNCARRAAHRTIVLSLADGSSELQIPSSKGSQSSINSWLFCSFIFHNCRKAC